MIIVVLVGILFIFFLLGMAIGSTFIVKMINSNDEKDRQWVNNLIVKDKIKKQSKSFQDKLNDKIGGKP